MERLFVNVIETTLPISLWIILLLVFSPMLKKSYTVRWRYYMWFFVAIRMLLPLRIYVRPLIEMPVAVQTVSDISQGYENDMLLTLTGSLTFIWSCGIAVIAINRLISYFSFKGLVKRWSRDISKNSVLKTAEQIKENLGIKKSIPIKSCKAISTPMLFGVIRPVLLLPEIEFSDEELPIILLHEMVHFKRKDIWYKLLMVTVNTIHWFNPLSFIMVKAANRDMELACDAFVVKNKNSEFRKTYCESIMRLVHNGSGRSAILTTCYCFSKRTIMERFKNILDTEVKRNGIMLFCVIGALITCSVGIIDFITESNTDENEIKEIAVLEEPFTQTDEKNSINTKETIQTTVETKQTDTVNTRQEEYAENKVSKPVIQPQKKRVQSVTVNNHIAEEQEKSYVNTESVQPQTKENEIAPENVLIGTERKNVYEQIGQPDTISGDGSKETYNLPDGNTAVLQYDGEVLDTGYIVME